jgi:DNA polymerase-3 subunit alpha
MADSKDLFKFWIKQGFEYRSRQRPEILDRRAEYNARVKYEFRIICDKDFQDYFLVVSDLIRWAKFNDITVGPGRGSAAGSLICYLLRITEVDPLHPEFRHMTFERFLDPYRTDWPDIDSDFDDTRRKEVVDYAQKKYGPAHTANVANHIKYRGKRALQDIARAYQLPGNAFDAIGKKCELRIETDTAVDNSILDTVESYRDDEEVSRILENFPLQISQAIALEGNQHSMGIHAGGLIVSSEPIVDVCAVYAKRSGTGRARKTVSVIPYEKRDAEHLGFIKIDVLGLTTMGMLGIARSLIGMTLEDLYGLFYIANEETHKSIVNLFLRDDVTGIFQYEGGTTRQVVRDVRPTNFTELAACNALSRPGPFYGGQTKEYIAVKNGEKDFISIHPDYDKHVEFTYGQIVYQEQIMAILRDVAGFDTKRVLAVRKIIGKKLGEFQFTELWEEFKNGCLSHGVTEESASKIWFAVRNSANYAFNASHAYTYALIAWWQAWLKLNHPQAFYVATLNKTGDGKNEIVHRTEILKDAVAHGISVAPFELEQCEASWSIDCVNRRGDIRFGFAQIPGVGEMTARDLAAVGAKDWTELAAVDGIGDNSIIKMIEFCMADDPMGIYAVEKQLKILRRQLEKGEFNVAGLQLPRADELLNSAQLRQDVETDGWAACWAAFVGYSANIIYRDEIQSIRAKTGQSIDEIRNTLAHPEKTKKATLFAYDEHGEVAIRVSRWVFDTVSGELERIKHHDSLIIAWGRVFKDRPGAIQVKNLWVLEQE